MAIDLDGPNSAINVNTIETHSGSTLTIGKSGDTVSLGSGASASGFSKDGAITWDSSIKTANTSITTGTGFFVDTTSAAITITLPASPSVGNIVGIKDYAGTFGTNNLTIARNGSNIQGIANDSLISTNRASVVLVYADATRGWLYTVESNVANLELPTFIQATGGTITTSGNYKIHTFTSSGTFTVSALGNSAGGPNNVDYMVVAGGGGGGKNQGGGGGAGGFRESVPSPADWSASPLANPGNALPVSVQGYPVTVGSGGNGGNPGVGGAGSNSVFSTITSAGGGLGGSWPALDGGAGGSGGGGGSGPSPSNHGDGGSGNTPSVSPPQGRDGSGGRGTLPDGSGSGAGGGATAAGGGNTTDTGGAGGNGATTSISGSSTAYAGGGAGNSRIAPVASGGTGGGGDGGFRNPNPSAVAGSAGTTNTGGGGGGSPAFVPGTGGAGGSGIVIIRYKFQ